jgi:hypothetical protein
MFLLYHWPSWLVIADGLGKNASFHGQSPSTSKGGKPCSTRSRPKISSTFMGWHQPIGSPTLTAVTLIPAASQRSCSFSRNCITASTGKSPRKLEPKLALVLMPASVAPWLFSLSSAIVLVPIITHSLLSCIASLFLAPSDQSPHPEVHSEAGSYRHEFARPCYVAESGLCGSCVIIVSSIGSTHLLSCY